MSATKTFTALAAAVVLLLIAMAAYLAIARPPHTPSSPAAQLPRIKVGVIVSEFTASGPHWLAKSYGFASVQRMVRELRDPSLELIPLIEPATQEEPDLKDELRKDFPGVTADEYLRLLNSLREAELQIV